jgi:hypothetical protein
MKIHKHLYRVTSYYYVCIVEICHRFTQPVFNNLHFFITTHARATQKLLQVCEQEKITCSQVRTVRRMKKKTSQVQFRQVLYANYLYFLEDWAWRKFPDVSVEHTASIFKQATINVLYSISNSKYITNLQCGHNVMEGAMDCPGINTPCPRHNYTENTSQVNCIQLSFYKPNAW